MHGCWTMMKSRLIGKTRSQLGRWPGQRGRMRACTASPSPSCAPADGSNRATRLTDHRHKRRDRPHRALHEHFLRQHGCSAALHDRRLQLGVVLAEEVDGSNHQMPLHPPAQLAVPLLHAPVRRRQHLGHQRSWRSNRQVNSTRSVAKELPGPTSPAAGSASPLFVRVIVLGAAGAGLHRMLRWVAPVVTGPRPYRRRSCTTARSPP